MTDDGDDAFLDKLAALLDNDSNDFFCDDVSVSAQPAPSIFNAAAVRDAPTVGDRPVQTGKKREISSLRYEIDQLSTQLERLRDARSTGATSALIERQRRQRAEAECDALREAVYRQTQFIRGLRAVVGTTPSFPMTVDLCHFLHRHTRLPLDRATRWGEYSRHVEEKRMQSAVEMLCRETQAISLADAATAEPFVHCERLDDRHGQGVTSTAVYALATDDVGAVARATCVALRDVVAICPCGHPLHVARDIVDADAPPASNALYRVMGVQHRCPHTGEDLAIESNIITTYRIAADHAIVLWDFVDEDERHPTLAATNITREITGACLIRRERGGDGVARTVFRSLTTKKFRFHGESAAQKLGKFDCVTQLLPMVRVDELLFRGIVLEQLAAERAAYAPRTFTGNGLCRRRRVLPSETITVTLETTDACFIRYERCDDGVERVVFRSLDTKKFRFHTSSRSRSVQTDTMVRGDERLFRWLAADQLAVEQALDAQAAYV